MSGKRKQNLTLCGLRPRAWTELVSESPIRIKFCYPCGYSTVVEAEKDKNMKRIAPVLLRRFASGYWSKTGGGCTDECPRCRRVKLKERREARCPGRTQAPATR